MKGKFKLTRLTGIARGITYLIASVTMASIIASIVGLMVLESVGLNGKSETYCQDYAIHKVANNYAGLALFRIYSVDEFPEYEDMKYMIISANNWDNLTTATSHAEHYHEYSSDGFSTAYLTDSQVYRSGVDGSSVISGTRIISNQEISYFDESPVWKIITGDYYNLHREVTDDSFICYKLYYYIDVNNLTQPDFIEARNIGSTIYSISQLLMPVLVVSVLLYICSLIILLVFTRRETTFTHRIPYLVFIILSAGAVGIAFALCTLLLDMLYSYAISIIAVAFLAFVLLTLACYFFIEFMVNTVERIKLHAFWHNTLLYYLSRFSRRILSYISTHSSLLAKVIVGIIILTAIQLAIMLILFGIPELGLIFGIIYKIAAVMFLVKLVLDYNKLSRGAASVAAGNSKDKIDTTKMFSIFRGTSENINNIGDGIAAAVSEQMKSERMKTELITNVSHDIKTPLTSIINYVDLLEKKDIGSSDSEAAEYLEVLSRQSARLKKLIEDLIEASKASTGNVEMHIEPVNAAMIISQATAEFADKMDSKSLSLVMNLPENAPDIQADGRYLWRVIDNLLNNICKYSMDGTRVYIDINENDSDVAISFKNISSTPLNITAEELTERFVRGDSSRNTEGSGLGLSIARSLTELMGGRFHIAIDGDLFKITLIFDK